jgi:hypothetical protein
MENIIKGLIGLAVLAFLLAVIDSVFFDTPLLGIHPEGYSRSCSNLALIAIALSVGWKVKPAAG